MGDVNYTLRPTHVVSYRHTEVGGSRQRDGTATREDVYRNHVLLAYLYIISNGVFFQLELDKARTIPDDILVGDRTRLTTHGFESDHTNPCLKS